IKSGVNRNRRAEIQVPEGPIARGPQVRWVNPRWVVKGRAGQAHYLRAGRLDMKVTIQAANARGSRQSLGIETGDKRRLV
ncbi:MAG: hypothetical protein ACXWWG_08860, partial [Nitrospira sp.]